MDDEDLGEASGSITEVRDGDQLILLWTDAGTDGPAVEMLRYLHGQRLVRLSPRIRRPFEGLVPQFEQVAEIQFDSDAVSWDAEQHSAMDDYGHLQAEGLPRGFERRYVYGLGIEA